MNSEILAGIIGGLVGSLAAGVIQYILQKVDKKASFRFNKKIELYLQIEKYWKSQNILAYEPLKEITYKEKYPNEKELKDLVNKLLNNIEKLEGVIYGGYLWRVIHKDIVKEVSSYKQDLGSYHFNKNKLTGYEELLLRTNFHVNTINQILSEELIG